MNAVIYPRVSSLKQVDGTSLSVQEQACRKWCEDNGVIVEMAFLEKGESAKTADRKQLQAALAYVKARGDIDYFVVHKVDRFARRSQDYFNLRDELTQAGCRLVSVSERLDDSPSGRFMEGMLSLQAQFDNEVRAERSKSGMLEVVKRGGWAWSPPIGFVVTRGTNNIPTLAHDPVTAPLVKMVFEECLAGAMNTRVLGEYAYKIGLRTKHGKKIATSSLLLMLRNPVYAGRGRTRMVEGEYNGNWESIISLSLYKAVQDRLDSNSKSVRKVEKEEFYLDRLVHCEHCGGAMLGYYATGRQGRKYPYFKCGKCKGQNIKLSEMNAEFEALLDRMRFDEEYHRDICKAIEAELATMGLRAAEEREGRQRAIMKLEAKEKRLFELVLAQTIDEKTYKIRFKELQREINELRSYREDTQYEVKDVTATMAYFSQMVLEPRKMWCKASRELKLDLQRLWFPDGITFNKNHPHRTTLNIKTPTLYNESIGACSVWLPRLDSNQRHMD